MTPVRTVSASCRGQTTVACRHCHSEALVCGTIGEATERMGRELAALRAIADAARAWHAARTSADLSDVSAVARADAELMAVVEAER